MLFVCYPKCTTCQKARTWLDAQGVSYEVRDIKLQNPSAEELRQWWQRSGLPLKKFFNTSGLQYKALGLKDKLRDVYKRQLPRRWSGSLASWICRITTWPMIWYRWRFAPVSAIMGIQPRWSCGSPSRRDRC